MMDSSVSATPVLCLALLLVGCGGDAGAGTSVELEPRPEPAPVQAPEPQRSTDPRVEQARAALDFGDLTLALALVPQAAEVAPGEAPLLRARLAALQGEEFEALRLIEEARRRHPLDPDVHATASELHAAAARLTEADLEIRRGIEAAGGISPELIRARGIHMICTVGQARAGLKLLLEARQLDPTLPFIDRALGQAHLLVAKEQLAASNNKQALESIRRSLEHDPEEFDTRRLRGEVLMLLGEWVEGIQLYEELLLDGLPLESELSTYYKNAGFWATTHGDRELGIKYYLRALELGFPRGELGHGIHLLQEEALALTSKGVQSHSKGDLDEAWTLLKQAVHLDPESLEARNFLGSVQHAKGAMEEAAASWNWVIDTARLKDQELPEPLHLRLAQLQALGMGNLPAARSTLDAYLVLEPEGQWLSETRALLQALPPAAQEPPEDGDSGAEGAGGGR